jgi:hypothetical protein
MIVDCMTCPVRGQRCDDCAVTVLLAPGSAGRPSAAEPAMSTELMSTELLLDAAERRVVSMFVGAGMVNAGAAAVLRARRERVHQHRETVREVG